MLVNSEPLNMEHVTVGMFKLPGLHFPDYTFTEDLLKEMEDWSEENNCGMKMTDLLWAFKNDEHKQWFLMRWLTEINKACPEKS